MYILYQFNRMNEKAFKIFVVHFIFSFEYFGELLLFSI